MGKHKYIETPQKMWELFIEYKNSVKNNPAKIQDYVGKDAEMVYREKEKPLTLEGFECYLFDKEIISDLSNYFANSDNKYSEYSTICSHIRKVIKNDQIQGGMIGIYNPSITQRLNGLTETITTTIKEQPLFGEK
jgi:cellulase/cellobiase CelA1